MTNSKALANIDQVNFNSPVLASEEEQEEIFEAFASNMEDMEPEFIRVKVPSGGGLVFEIPGEDEEPETMKELVGVILDHYPVNAFWKEKYSGQNNPPDCNSLDGKVGQGDPGGNCAQCPHNQWESDEAGRGKACKNLRRVYLLPEGEIFPYLIAVPPTSLREFKSYMSRLTSKLRKPYWGVITKIKLKKAKNNDGIEYSQLTFSCAGDLPSEQAKAMKDYAYKLKSAMRSLGVDDTEYSTESSTSTEEFM